MLKWFFSLDVDLKITVISILVTASISIISTIIALLALRTTRKSILEANRPYVVAYFDVIDVGHYKKYLVIKNYGKSGAQITKLHLNIPFSDERLNNFILDCSNRYIAPNQSFKTVIKSNEVFTQNMDSEPLQLRIEYKDSIKIYKEIINLYPLAFNNQSYIESSISTLSTFENKLINALHALKKSDL